MEVNQEEIIKDPTVFFQYPINVQWNMLSRMGWPSINNLCYTALLLAEKERKGSLLIESEKGPRDFFDETCKSADFWKFRIREDFGQDVYDKKFKIAKRKRRIEDFDFWRREYKKLYDEAGRELAYLIWNHEYEKVRKLLHLEVDPNITTSGPGLLLPLIETSKLLDEKEGLEITQLLLDNDADPNLTGEEGMSPLLAAVKYENYNIARLLLNSGAEPNLPLSDGTPLQEAALLGNVDITQLLLDYNADPNIPDAEGLTPIWYSELRLHDLITELLLQAGADPELNV